MRIVLGVTGGIAAYKVTELIRELKRLGHEVTVIPTRNALKFIGASTLEALSGHPVTSDVFSDVDDVKHVSIGQNADLVIIAPATASFLAKFAAGIADDLLGTTLLATKAPILVAPAMHTEMWMNPATVTNVRILSERGIAVLEPSVGELTSGDVGVGRLPDASVIIEAALSLRTPKDLAGKRILITAGGTQSKIDAVRYLGNHSSGKQGIAIAKAAHNRGAEVELVLANVDFSANFKVTRVSSNVELRNAVERSLQEIDVLIMAAAIVDFELPNPTEQKIKRHKKKLELKLKPTEDLLALFSKILAKRGTAAVTVGFAAETMSGPKLIETAREKLLRKGCDLVVANDVSEGKVFSKDDTEIFIVSREANAISFKGSKSDAASILLDEIARRLS